MTKTILLATTLLLAATAPVEAAPRITDANDIAAFVDPTPPFGPLAEAIGDQTLGTGIDFSFGNVEGIFNDGGPYAICGIESGNCSLTGDVDGRIVGLARSIFAEAGLAGIGALTLSVYDSSLNLLDTATNDLPLGMYGRTTFSITRPSADIAYFRISGGDTYGVNRIVLDAVPEPATWAMMIGGIGLAGGALRRRRAVAFA